MLRNANHDPHAEVWGTPLGPRLSLYSNGDLPGIAIVTLPTWYARQLTRLLNDATTACEEIEARQRAMSLGSIPANPNRYWRR